MKRTLSTEQLPPSTQQQDSDLPATPAPGTPAEQTQSEPVIVNRIATTSSVAVIEKLSRSSLPIDEHTALEKSDRSTNASSSVMSATNDDLLGSLVVKALSGDSESQFALGVHYLKGEGVEINKEKAFEWFHKAAEQDHLNAQVSVGVMYDNGEGVEIDKGKAIFWFERAAWQGHSQAQYYVGSMYDDGEGVEVNKKEAFTWFHKAAMQGVSRAQYYVGVMYDDGDGVKVDKEKAVMWYEKAARQGDLNAKFNLGVMYRNGEGIEADDEKAVDWYRRAAEQGHVSAQVNLGNMYIDYNYAHANIEKSFMWYQKAAEQGDLKAQFNLGLMYKKGQGVEVNKEKAFAWFHKAANQGFIDAQFELGTMYFEGDGIKANKEKTIYWYQKAAEQGSSRAQQGLSGCYRDGLGVKQDLSLATYWLLRSTLVMPHTPIRLDGNHELIKLIASTQKNYSEFTNLNRIELCGKVSLSNEDVTTIAYFIRSNSNIKSLIISLVKSSNKDDVGEAVAEALKFNRQLTMVTVNGLKKSKEISDQIEVLLTQNRDIAELRQYVKDLRIEKTPGFPFDVVKIMADKTVVAYLKSGQTKEATKKAIDELLIIAGIKALEEDSKTS